jgi:hypothetical protein
MITITHTQAAGTLIEGSSKGDGVYEILRGLGGNWRYLPSIGQLGIGQSRDKLADGYKIRRAVEALRAAGHDVTTEIDDTVARDFAEAEAERYALAEDRAERHAGYAQNAEARATGHWEAERQILDFIPPGQPILVGHHSEGRHRRDLQRADNHMRSGIAELGKRDYHQARAESSAGHQAARESIPTTLRRIERLQADARKVARRIQGDVTYDLVDGAYKSRLVKPEGSRLERLQLLAANYAEQIAYWQAHVDSARDSGVKVWGPADFTKGDFARFLGSWYQVLRVNAKSVTIPAMISDGYIVTRESGYSWTDTIPYHKITERKSAEEIAGIIAQADARAELEGSDAS